MSRHPPTFRAPLRVVSIRPDPWTAAEPAPSLASLYDRYSGYVASTAVRLLGRDEDLEDVVHDVFTRAAVALSTLRDPAAAKNWLASITVRVALRRLRWRRLRLSLGLDEQATYEELPDPGLPPDRQAWMAQIYRKLDLLPASSRAAWTLHHMESMTLEEVAAVCACSLATVKRRVARASHLLKRMFGHG